ncbi:FecR family protein [Carboxylicivirga sp. RSCT41]|uniref:FecR family protein n=1 Tax=Carboxylicivirga agarovorans TaxID=3417570 RepID=UPI003D33A149
MNKEHIIQYLSDRMCESEKQRFYTALENDRELKKEFIKQKNLWAVSTSLGEKEASQESDTNLFLYRLNKSKEDYKVSRHLTLRLNIYKVAAVVMFALLIASVAMMLNQTNQVKDAGMLFTETYVPRGEMSELTLPDGTHITLNADTRLRIPSNFSGANRQLELEGEAYFKVKHDKENPFIVKTASINIEVLGTSFDISCYPDEEMVTTVLDEGKIRFAGANNNMVNGTFLKPGETAYYHKTSGVFKVKETAKSDKVSSWKQGVITFKDMPFYLLVKKIERQYDVEIEVDESLLFEKYTGEINEETVWAVMNNFAIATPFNVESSGRKIKITPKKNY